MQDKTQALAQRRTQAVARGVNQAHAVYVQRAENALLWDVEGRRYVDFCGGIAALNTGHLHPQVVDAVQAQLQQFTHTCFAALPYEGYIAVCEAINARVPGDFAKKTLLLTTGSEAVESALKIARVHTRRTGVIVFTGAYHGRTLMTLAMTAKVNPYAQGMGLMPGGVYRALFPDADAGVSVVEAMNSIHRIFSSDAAPEDIAAIVIEPVQGEGGFVVAPVAFMVALRALCDQHGIVLIADEIQCGAGRTGSFFAMEQMGVHADLIVFGKSIAGGLPLAGVTGKAAIMDAPVPGGLGGTYAGNPLACAAALAVLRVFDEQGLLDIARELGEELRDNLKEITDALGIHCRIRGLGAMVALELFDDAARRIPSARLTRQLIQDARARGLLLLACGQYGNVIRFLMPLTIPRPVLLEGLEILAACLTAIDNHTVVGQL